ncbi:MAG: 2Fe-2S iron-sulfur cluster-binding protein [Pseudomonadota bacterium]
MTSYRIKTVASTEGLRFTFDGKSYEGREGDTLASALLANGVRIMGRSFKYHRPRGPWGSWVEDSNAIMSVRLGDCELPNCAAATTILEDGMHARSVNAWPSANHDLKGVLDLFHRWLTAGFYYKTFMWPHWHMFEPSIRRMAGLGAVTDDVFQRYRSEQTHDRCDVLVVGGGAAGLVAARAAAESGRDTCLVDDHPDLGGGLLQMSVIEGESPREWIGSQRAAIQSAGGRILSSTTAFGVFDHQLVGLVQQNAFGVAPRLIRMRVGQIILATGAIDRPVTFANNDRPGSLSVQASCDYLARHDVLVGKRMALVSNNSFADSSEQLLHDAGAEIVRIDPVKDAPLRIAGRKHIKGIYQGRDYHRVDTIVSSGGMTPTVHLWRHAGGALEWNAPCQAFLPATGPEYIQVVGAANGVFTLEPALEHAQRVGRGESVSRPVCSFRTEPVWPKPGSPGRQWIDFQHDVTLKDVELAARENYISVEHLKRYTTLGMAQDQGKTSNMAGLAAMASIRARSVPDVGTTTFRPPFVPVPIELYHGPLHGRNRHSLKRLPLEHIHRREDAALCEYGGWLRPGWFGAGDTKDRIAAEVRTARSAVALFDGTPLGKIEVMGPDAEAFVNFIYYNTVSTLKPGQIRYGFMLTESGAIYDDGVITRMGSDRFLISCSSSHVDGVRTHLEAWRQDGNNPDRIFIHDTTHHWATLTVTGPSARPVISELLPDMEWQSQRFPHMTMIEHQWNGEPLRIARVSFTGDCSFELSIRQSCAQMLWETLAAGVRKHGGGLMGSEALLILRAEKGYIVIGKDTDGETMPHDLGFGVPRLKKSTAFLGDRSLHTAHANSPNRKQLVGLMTAEGASPLITGAHVVNNGSSQGYVTSSYFSPTLDHPIALALVENGFERSGEEVDVWHTGSTQSARICAPCFYDPTGELLDA